MNSSRADPSCSDSASDRQELGLVPCTVSPIIIEIDFLHLVLNTWPWHNPWIVKRSMAKDYVHV